MATFLGFPRDGYAFSAAEVGTALAGLIRRGSDGLPVAGVLGAPKITAVASAWRVRVQPFVYVARSGSSVAFSGVSAAEDVDIEAASATPIPAGQGRIDVVCWDASTATLVVVKGAPAASPVAPSTGGLPALATVRVNNGDSAAVGSRVVQTYTPTWVQGPEGAVLKGTVEKRSVAPASVTSIEVPFPAGLFVGTPNVQVTLNGDARDCTVAADNISKDRVIIRLGSNSTRARTIGAQWRAAE